ncbi:MAG: DUF4157 domain-containing protein [Nannocystis sp.]|nr:DUF4157 domain-containing protein [Nannocystis sp.]
MHERAADRVADAVMSNGPPQAHEHMRMGDTQRATDILGGGFAAPKIVSEVLDSPGSPLDAGVRAFMEARMGHDFSAVRVHSDARAAESTNALGAHAYTAGKNMYSARVCTRREAPRGGDSSHMN